MDILFDQIKAVGVQIQRDVPLGSCTSFHIGGNAALFATVDSEDQLDEVLRLVREEGVRVCVLGGGSNVLISDDGFDGLVINMQITDVKFSGNRLRVGAGATTAQLGGQCVARGLSGMEWAVGIPGRIGGAIVGNAGAMGGEMKDVIVSVRSIDIETGEIRERMNNECVFEYRGSIFKTLHEVIVSCEMELVAGDVQVLQEKLRDNLGYRNTTQPKRFGSSGCMFKNYEPREDELERLAGYGIPQNMLDARRISTGMLVDQAGCKGMRVGEAMISEDHGNFVINRGAATAAHVRELVEKVKCCVRDKYGIELTEEVRYIE